MFKKEFGVLIQWTLDRGGCASILPASLILDLGAGPSYLIQIGGWVTIHLLMDSSENHTCKLTRFSDFQLLGLVIQVRRFVNIHDLHILCISFGSVSGDLSDFLDDLDHPIHLV